MSINEIYDLDFTSVRNDFKTFISTHDKFKDYNFEGSALSSLLDVFAYFVQHQNYYLNAVSNELFLSTAKIENNIYKLANMLNYLPNRKSAPSMTVEITRTVTETILIPKFSKFKMGSIDLTNLTDIIITDNNPLVVTLHEGVVDTETFISDGTDFQTYQLKERERIDNDNLFVYVDVPDGSGGYILEADSWKNINILDYDSAGRNYYIDYFENFFIKFDNGKLFNKPNLDDRVRIIYLNTNGALNNGNVATVTENDPLIDGSKITFANQTVLVDGTDEETLIEIQTRAPQYFPTQSRAVVEKDYEYIVKKYSKFNTFDDITIWGGEKEYIDAYDKLVQTSPIKDLGHVYVSALKSDGTYLTTANQDDLLAFLYKRKFHAIFFRYVHPNVVKITPTANIFYKSVLGLDEATIQTSLAKYLDTIRGFKKEYKHSNFEAYINNLDDVDYVELTYTTKVKIKNNTHNAIRLGNAVVPNSFTGMINGNALLSDAAGIITYNSIAIGTIDYTTGFVVIEHDFGIADYEVNFEYVDIQYFILDKESMLDYETPILVTLN